ncbi:MAG: chorismate-binding protein [Micrococcales bacterium]|nr:chorismate-binding protein [Micrococcales bacterium]MCL2666584.1 chorismate-binding protein [Micrococcales bacterium]
MSTTAIRDHAVDVPRLVVRTVAIDDPGDLLRLLPPDALLSWVRRAEGLVGWGTAAQVDVVGPDQVHAAQDAWADLVSHAVVRDEVGLPGTGPVAFGSFAFDPTMGAGVLVVPSVLVGRRGGQAWLTTIGATATRRTTVSVASPVRAPGPVTYRCGALGPDAWAAKVGEAVAAIRAGRADKVVLARDVVARTTEPLDVRWALDRLARRYDSCWTFAVADLVGATPELLVRAERGLVTSRVLAGTIQRTGHDEADLARAGVLAHSSKDLEEHEYAVQSVADALAPYCTSTNVPDVPFVLPLPNVLHLASDITGVLADHVGSLGLVAALHPSAAVCGTPSTAAADLISELEHMDRGRYAGPVGWTGADGDGEWGIALRCAQVDPDDRHTVRLFAGCGVVAASDPAAEVAESNAKLEPMKYALGSD